jgi:colicin import membrane protein
MSTVEAEAVITTPKKLSVEQQLARFENDMAPRMESVRQYLILTIQDVDDKQQVAEVVEAHKKVKKLKAAIDAQRKELKKPHMELGRLIDKTGKTFIDGVSEVANHLQAERDKVKLAEEAKAAAEEQRAQAILQERINQLNAVNGDVSNLIAVRVMTVEQFTEALDVATKAHERQLAIDERNKVVSEISMQLHRYGVEISPDKLANLNDDEIAKLVDDARYQFEQAEAERQRKEAEKDAVHETLQQLAMYGQSIEPEKLFGMNQATRDLLVADAKQVWELTEADRKKKELAEAAERQDMLDRMEQQNREMAEMREKIRLQDEAAEKARLEQEAAEAKRLEAERVKREEAEEKARQEQEAAEAAAKSAANAERQKELAPRREYLHHAAGQVETLELSHLMDPEDQEWLRGELQSLGQRIIDRAANLM